MRLPRTVWCPGALGLALVLGAGCAGGGEESARSVPRSTTIALVTVGGLTTGSFAAAVDEHAELRELVQKGARFDRAYGASTLDVQSLAALFSGRLPTRGGSIGLVEAQPAPEATTLASRLRRAGYRTALVSQAPWAARPGFNRGFDQAEVAGGETASEGGWSAAEVRRRAVAALPATAGEDGRLFLAVHWGGATPLLDTPAAADGAAVRAAQTEALAEAAAFLATLRARAPDALVVLAGTAGWELGEHGGSGNGWTVYEEVARVPLIIAHPSLEPATVDHPVSLVDVTASLIAAGGAEEPAEDALDGVALLTGTEEGLELREPTGPRLVDLVVRERVIARAVVAGDHKYVHVLRPVPPSDRAAVAAGIEELQAAMLSGAIETPELFGQPAADGELLFDLSADPGETTNLLAEAPPELRALRSALRAYSSLSEQTAYAPLEITERLELDADHMRELESLGYL